MRLAPIQIQGSTYIQVYIWILVLLGESLSFSEDVLKRLTTIESLLRNVLAQKEEKNIFCFVIPSKSKTRPKKTRKPNHGASLQRQRNYHLQHLPAPKVYKTFCYRSGLLLWEMFFSFSDDICNQWGTTTQEKIFWRRIIKVFFQKKFLF